MTTLFWITMIGIINSRYFRHYKILFGHKFKKLNLDDYMKCCDLLTSFDYQAIAVSPIKFLKLYFDFICYI